MTDYIPTTEQIRMDYSCDYGGFLGERNKFREEYASVFDRWFAATIRAAQADAWKRGYGDGHADFCTTGADAGCGANARFENPYITKEHTA